MLSGELLVNTLVGNGFSKFTGVPCSYVASVIEAASCSDKCDYVAASNEGASLAIAAGHYLSGRLPVILLQNSGFGNLLNPLTSLTLPYAMGGLMLVTLRAYPDIMKDEPQHRLMGRETTGFLTKLGIEWRLVPIMPDELEAAASQAAECARKGQLIAWLVPKGSILPCHTVASPTLRPLSRQQAIEIVTAECRKQDLIVGATGMIGRELFGFDDRPGNFYMQGSMGHAINIGLGLTGSGERKVIVLDGDGSVLMHMGSLSTVGYYKPRDLIHVVLDNETYGTTGNQPTTSPTTDLVSIALASGYSSAGECASDDALANLFRCTLDRPGPHFIRVKVNQLQNKDVPRVTDRYSPEENSQRVLQFTTAGVDLAALVT